MPVVTMKPNEIKAKRAFYGMFQKDLAQETGLSLKDVSRCERGVGSMKTASVISLYFQQRSQKEQEQKGGYHDNS